MKTKKSSGVVSSLFAMKLEVNSIFMLCSVLIVISIFSCRKPDVNDVGATINVNPVNKDSCDLKTFTQGGWGASPHGNNPGVYLHKNFSGAFPKGLTVGCVTNYTLTLTSAQAVTDFLPCGGPPAALKASYTDPKGMKNVFAAQLVALTLSVGFDKYDTAFAGSPSILGNLTVKSGTFKGMTVNAILAEANNAFGGCYSKFSISDLVSILTDINENFDDGTTNNNVLNCSGIIVL